MADTAIALVDLELGGQNDEAGTAIVHANTHVITPTKRTSKLLIKVTNTTAAQKVATLLAGDNPPAVAAGQGSATVTLADGSTTPTVGWFLVDPSRHLQSDGTVHITVAASMTGTITAYQLP